MSAHRLLEEVKYLRALKNDARLAKFLDLSPGQISKLRSGDLRVTGDTVLLVYDKTGMSIERIRALAAA